MATKVTNQIPISNLSGTCRLLRDDAAQIYWSSNNFVIHYNRSDRLAMLPHLGLMRNLMLSPITKIFDEYGWQFRVHIIVEVRKMESGWNVEAFEICEGTAGPSACSILRSLEKLKRRLGSRRKQIESVLNKNDCITTEALEMIENIAD